MKMGGTSGSLSGSEKGRSPWIPGQNSEMVDKFPSWPGCSFVLNSYCSVSLFLLVGCIIFTCLASLFFVYYSLSLSLSLSLSIYIYIYIRGEMPASKQLC
jgi:hypothetical protein